MKKNKIPRSKNKKRAKPKNKKVIKTKNKTEIKTQIKEKEKEKEKVKEKVKEQEQGTLNKKEKKQTTKNKPQNQQTKIKMTYFQYLCKVATFDLRKYRNTHNSLIYRDLKIEIPIVLFITLLSFATRFYRLETPDSVIFDEVHFGGFVNDYHRGEYFFDIHKLILSASAKVFCPDYSAEFSFAKIGQQFPNNDYMCLRIPTAIIGSLLCPTMYMLCRVLNISIPVSTFVSIMILFENSVITESRLIVTDPFLFFFILVSIMFCIKVTKLRLYSKLWYFFIFVAGITLGCAFSVKVTAIGVIVGVAFHELIFIHDIHKDWKSTLKYILIRGFAYLIPMLLIYYISFYFHFNLMPYSGEGDAYSFDDQFIGSLINKTDPLASLPYRHPVSTIPLTTKMTFKMQQYNMGVEGGHPFSSNWTSWPLHTCTVMNYWEKKIPNSSEKRYVFCLGNPIVWWFNLAAIIFYLLYFLRGLISVIRNKPQGIEKKYSRSQYFWALIDSTMLWGSTFVIMYLVSLTIYAGVPRCTFLYHYTPILLTAVPLTALVLDAFVKSFIPKKSLKWFTVAILSIPIILGYVFFIPWIYSFPITTEQFDKMFWFKSWHA
ncbi:dolichyl-phosphate-mannose--protein mannosyltransferase [Anaeramoeba flamelloides]|uniref:Dolichyl-phosphate-mannose--protein mannosyltransferase n=1 Tax=Anaeramoeba flamelloides TaxID=1746091 RepID=A0ABQ8X5T9_9EUKA|nr:dolichyl-phosphate-mannose--protein mannosyltransferase [Anaeramoeba flamelloides]